MIETMSGRAKELEKISLIIEDRKRIKETPVRVDHRTIILVREGRDKLLAVEEFRAKQTEANKREFKNELQY